MKAKLSSSPREAWTISRTREIYALLFLYEQGIATSKQIGQFVMRAAFNPRCKYHHLLMRRMHERRLVAYISSPAVPDRVYFLTDNGSALLLEKWGCGDYWIPHVDFHSGRSGTTTAHHLAVNDIRIKCMECGYDFISERTIRAAWGKEFSKIPDALIGIPSVIGYWPSTIPIALELENSSRSENRRLQMIGRTENLIGKRVAGILVVGKKGVVGTWRKTLKRAKERQAYTLLDKRGLNSHHFSSKLLRFWSVTTIDKLHETLSSIRTAYLPEGIAPFSWEMYSPWLELRRLRLISNHNPGTVKI